MRRTQLQAGISLVEALAALVILSLGATVALTWFIGSADRVSRLREEEAMLLSKLNAMDFVRSINPAERPEGQLLLAGQQLSWSSQIISGPTRSMNKRGGDGPFELTLHQVQVILTSPAEGGAGTNSPAPVSFEMKLAGYRYLAGADGVGAVFGVSR
jgi:general secretion pathway protein I